MDNEGAVVGQQGDTHEGLAADSSGEGASGSSSGKTPQWRLAREEAGVALEEGEGEGEGEGEEDGARPSSGKVPFIGALPLWRKWSIIVIYFFIQLSAHFNTAVYSDGVQPISDHFHVSQQAARVGQAVFLIAYAIGAQIWSPWSEDKGRKLVIQLSLTLVNAMQILCALAPNFGALIVGRALGGLFTCSGSVSVGIVADVFGSREPYATALIIFGSVGGSALGPVVGPFVHAYLSWQWFFWLQLIFGAVVQLLHLVFVPETRHKIITERRRKHFGPHSSEEKKTRDMLAKAKYIAATTTRSLEMLAREPIVQCCSLLSGFSDALIFSFMGSFRLIYAQWGFEAPVTAAAFAPVWIGYFLCLASFVIPTERIKTLERTQPQILTPESRLLWLLFTGPLLVVGLFGFAWTSFGPSHNPWIAPMIFTALVGIANLAIYIATIDYCVYSYGPYASSAASGNTFVRNILAGSAAMYTNPLYERLGYEWASSLLGFISIIVVLPMFLFYFKGFEVRKRSRFAREILEKGEVR